MDTQFKKGLLEMCVLKAVESEESYGYQIISTLSPYVELSESTLYTILKRLENSNVLSSRSEEFSGRLRKYYSITKSGKQKLQDFRNTQADIYKIYNFLNMEVESK